MDAIGSHGSSYGFKLTYGLFQIVGMLVMVLIAFWLTYYCGGFAWSSEPLLQFNWHPLCMAFGLVYLSGNELLFSLSAILIYRGLRFERKRKLKLAHAGIQIVGFCSVVFGLKAVFSFHDAKGIANMYSLHSWIGLITVILFACQWCGGLISFLYPGIKSDLRSKYLPLHVVFGVIIFVLSCTAAIMGLLEKAIFKLGTDGRYQSFNSEGILINFIGLLIFVFGALGVYLVVQPTYKRVALAEDELLLHRRKVLESSQELREFEARLRGAYVRKAQIAQMAAKRLTLAQEKSEAADERLYFEQEAKLAAEEARLLEESKREESQRYARVLEVQLEERRRQEVERVKEQLKDRVELEKLAAREEEEDRQEMADVKRKQLELRAAMLDLFEAKRRWMEESRRVFEIEETLRQDYVKKRRLEEEDKKQQKAQTSMQIEAVKKMLAEKIQAEREEKEELERIREILWEEEKRKKEKEFWEEAARKHRQHVQELKINHVIQLRLREEEKAREKEEEARLRREMMKWYAEQERVELYTAQKRRAMEAEHRKSVETMILERRVAKELERQEEDRQWQEWQAEEEKRRRIIEEEQERLILEHGPTLGDMLPKLLSRTKIV
ncbi:unnamed protein product [Notodromas monacha]|uniref:Cytochrome b561 domain-containing protein n=1 Tax=Notodromas monacha TaxID=399045 RepID=A0A7R9BHI3_9CRUS|nr:unnamed protein product [Notodromas monacha]CAG0914770.1 unnamed protein product [Notodromas monacha]